MLKKIFITTLLSTFLSIFSIVYLPKSVDGQTPTPGCFVEVPQGTTCPQKCNKLDCQPVGSTTLCRCNYNPTCGGNGINTAIGCIPVDNLQEFLRLLLQMGMGLGGAAALILIVFGGFMISSSGGNAQRLQAGKELVTAAFTGLILLIFGVFILKFVGVDVLKLPDFGI